LPRGYMSGQFGEVAIMPKVREMTIEQTGTGQGSVLQFSRFESDD